MKKMTVLMLAVLGYVASGFGSCGPTNPTGPTGPSGTVACQITLSGGLSGTYSCEATLGYDQSNNLTSLAITPTNAPSNLTVTIDVAHPGQPNTGTFSAEDAGAKGGVTIVSQGSGYQMWGATAPTSSQPQKGTYSYTVTDLGTAVTGSSGDQAYPNPHGTVDANAVPFTGSTTDVDVSVEF